MTDAFLLKNVSKLLTGANEDWILVAEAIIRKTLQGSHRTQEIKNWSTTEILLGLDSFRVKESPTLDRMLQVWYKLKRKLRWIPTTGPHPTAASAKFALRMATFSGAFQQHETQLLATTMRAARIRNIDTFQPQTTIKEYVNSTGVGTNPETNAILDKWEHTFPTLRACDITWIETEGWTWDGDNPKGSKCWQLSTAEWRRLLYSTKDDTDKLNKKWDTQQTAKQWKLRWKRLWNGPAQARTKIRAWRFLRAAYFTNAKAKTWGLGDGMCSRCNMEQETYVHAIWECPRTIERNLWVSWLLTDEDERTTNNSGGEPLLPLIDRALRMHRHNPAPLILMLATLRANWAERNDAQFNQKINFRGVQPIFRETDNDIEKPPTAFCFNKCYPR
ncbi:hypothetical protein R1sor_025771 [Riccia sorocarpa]|uniref:Reverse transcriptase zinc-binding domain-containing protein n=1 Tax=Riccia sorocarpa TaxID=122646 RepID=A0ABD3G9J9_9MARC